MVTWAENYQHVFENKEHYHENNWDVVMCIGPNDSHLISTLIPNVTQHIAPRHTYIITMPDIVDSFQHKFGMSVTLISEDTFPFSIQMIHDLFKTKERSGWYLQQLLKVYAPIIITEMKDNYIIIDADVRFNKTARFFENGKIQFNVGTEYHIPYFEHMNRLIGISKQTQHSGICHMMPMKRHIVESFIAFVEKKHGIPCWKAFLDNVDRLHYGLSGASEYELLFNYAQVHFSNEIEIRPLTWWQHDKQRDPEDVYEVYHWYNR